MSVTLQTSVSQGSQSVSDNTTVISIESKVISTYGSYNLESPPGKYEVRKNSASGAVIASGSFKSNYYANTTTTIFSKKVTVPHESDGTRTVYVKVTFDDGVHAGEHKSEITKTLSTIPRTSGVSAVACNIGASTVITINRASDTFTHTLQYGYGASPSSFSNIVTKTKTATYGWTVPAAAYAYCKNAQYTYITIRCYTYSGATNIGYKDCAFKAAVDKDVSSPAVTLTAADANTHAVALTGSSERLIKGVSTVSFTASGAAKNSASLSKINVSLGGTKKESGSSPFSGEILKAAAAVLTATVTDSRGFTASASKTFGFVDYSELTIGADVSRKTPTGDVLKVSLSGAYFNGSFGATANSILLKYRKAETREALSSAEYVEISAAPTFQNGRYSLSLELSGFDYDKEYYISFSASDAVYDGTQGYAAKEITRVLPRGVPVFDWGKNDFNFNVPVTIKGSAAWHGKNLKIAAGSASITPTPNQPTSCAIEFSEGAFDKAPYILLTPVTQSPGTAVLGVGVRDVTKNGFTIWLMRTSNVETWVHWLAISIDESEEL